MTIKLVGGETLFLAHACVSSRRPPSMPTRKLLPRGTSCDNAHTRAAVWRAFAMQQRSPIGETRVAGVADRDQYIAHEAVAPIRLTGDFLANSARKAASSSRTRLWRAAGCRVPAGRRGLASRPVCANLFQGAHGETIVAARSGMRDGFSNSRGIGLVLRSSDRNAALRIELVSGAAQVS